MTFSTDFRISIQRALWGEIRPSICAIALRWDDSVGHARFVFDHTPTDEDKEIVSNIETEVLADFPIGSTFNFIAEAGAVDDLAFKDGERWWAYVRWEPSP